MIRVLAGIALALIVLAAALYSDGDDGGTLRAIEAERTQRTQLEQAERTQREAMAQAGLTERTAINATTLMWLATEREATMRLVVVLLLVIVAASAGLVAVVLVVRAPRRHDDGEMERLYLESIRHELPPYWRIEKVPHYGWCVTSGDRFILPRDVRALIAERR